MRLIIGQYDYGVSRNMSADDVDGATNSKPKSIPKFDSPTYIKSYPETILPISPRNSNSNAIPPRNSIISSSISQSCAKQRVIDPTNADILIAQATTPNFVAWRNRELGSWFIQSICEIFAQFAATEDIQGMLTRVNSRVAMRESDKDRAKQIPETTSTLRKKFYFFPGIERELF